VDDRRFRVVAIIAGVLFAPQVIAAVLVPFTVLPTFRALYSDMGGPLPSMTILLFTMGPLIGVVLGFVDVLIFWLFYRLARKYWIGLLFAPLSTGGLLMGPLIAALDMPMFQVITLVK
jgi:hypothetical protein